MRGRWARADELADVEASARILAVSERSVHEALRAGLLRTRDVDGVPLLRLGDVLLWRRTLARAANRTARLVREASAPRSAYVLVDDSPPEGQNSSTSEDAAIGLGDAETADSGDEWKTSPASAGN